MRTQTTTPPVPGPPSDLGWVSLPDEAQLRRLGREDGQARAASQTGPADDVPAHAWWILHVGGVLAEGPCPTYGAAQRQTLPGVAESAAATALAGATRVEATATARIRQHDLDTLEDHEPVTSGHFAFLTRLPWLPYAAFLTGLGVAETVFNVGAFQITGEDAWRVMIMAALVGLSSAMSGHLLGSSVQEIAALDPTRDNRRAWTRPTMVRAAVGVVLALFMLGGLAAVSNLRTSYYAYTIAQQADTSQATISGLAPSGAFTPGAAGGPETGATVDALPAVSGVALFALNLMVWVVAIAAGYHHASIHRQARRHLRRDHAAAAKHHDTSRAQETKAIADLLARLAAAIELVGNALADAHKQVLLTNAAVTCYLAAYLAALDEAGVAHFTIDKAPHLALPDWAQDAEAQLKLFRSMRDQHLANLATATGYAETASAPSRREILTPDPAGIGSATPNPPSTVAALASGARTGAAPHPTSVSTTVAAKASNNTAERAASHLDQPVRN